MLASGVHIGSTISVIFTFFGILVLVASSVAVVRTSVFKAQVEGLRGDRDDQKVRIDRLEEDLAAEKLRADTAEARVQVLENVVTGREQLASISSLLQAHDRKAERKAEDILKAIQEAAS